MRRTETSATGCRLLEKTLIKRLREQFTHPVTPGFAIQVCKNDFQIACEFPQHLPTRPTGRRRRVGRRDDRHSPELAVPFRQRLEQRDALGTHGEAIRCVFDVAARDDRPIRSFERGTHFEPGIVGMRVLANRARSRDEGVDLRIPNPVSRIPV